MILLSLLLFSLSSLVQICRGEVILLDSNNFEHLTQASTGATTGDWLIKFYAPWCGHCKRMMPVYEEVSEVLKNEINVAKVDVTTNRDLGTRFDIKGFPTLKLLRQGKVYTFKGRRTIDDIVEFARQGYQTYEAENVHPPLGIFGEIGFIYRNTLQQAVRDLKSKRFLTIDVFLVLLPFIFLALVLILFLLPTAPNQVHREVVHQTDYGTEHPKEDKTKQL